MNIFSVDAESDGLYGDIFAIGVIAVDENHEIVGEFGGIAEADAVKDPWVRENILPQLAGLCEFKTRREMRDAFWAFWAKHGSDAICLADFGAPVEALLFRKCIEDDLENRMWNGPYPMHELGTVLMLAGVDPDVNRIEYARAGEVRKHNPADDAAVAAACYFRAMEELKCAG